MSAIEDTLTRCFMATFPGLSVAQVTSASVETVTQWDSLHTVILAAVLEEAFAVRVPARDYPALRSYDAVREYLSGRVV